MPQTITLVLDDTQGSIAEFNEAFNNLVKGVESLTAANAALQSEVNTLKSAVPADLSGKIAYLESENLGLCERAAALESEVTSLKNELATIKANMAKAADALDDGE